MSLNNKNNNKNDSKANSNAKSRYLSWALRHGLNQLGLQPDSEGYVKLSDLLTKSQGQISGSEVITIVNNCPKQRFGLKQIDNELYIRANQGHSKEVGDLIVTDNLMNKLSEPIADVFHGSYVKHLESIKANGLNRMSRKHIHFAKSLDAASGKRSDCNLLVYVDMAKAMADGIDFYESANGVILTEGIGGTLDSKYLIFKQIK